MRINESLPDFFNVAAGSNAILNLPVGLSYDLITIELVNGAKSDIERIELKGNGRMIQEFSGGALQVDEVNKYHGRGVDADLIDLHQVRPELANLGQRRMFSLGTADLQTLTLNVKIAAGAPANIQLKAYAIKSEQEASGLVTLIREFPVTFNASGEMDISNLPFDAQASIGCIHFFKEEDDIQDLRILINQKNVFELSANVAEKLQAKAFKDPSSAKYFRADWMLEGDIAQALIWSTGISDFRIKPTIGSGGEVKMLVEYLGPIGSM